MTGISYYLNDQLFEPQSPVVTADGNVHYLLPH